MKTGKVRGLVGMVVMLVVSTQVAAVSIPFPDSDQQQGMYDVPDRSVTTGGASAASAVAPDRSVTGQVTTPVSPPPSPLPFSGMPNSNRGRPVPAMPNPAMPNMNMPN